MRLEQMTGYLFPTLAVWPKPWYEGGLWQMYDFKLREDGTLEWYKSYIATASGHAKADVYESYEDAKEVAVKRNGELKSVLDKLGVSSSQKASLSLKVDKAVTRQSRLFGEEQLMLLEGIRRHSEFPRPQEHEIVLPKNCTSLLKPLMDVLQETPYVKLVRLKSFGVSLLRQGDHDWSTLAKHTKLTAKYFYREKIAAAYGLDGADHWGQTKAKIREILLPRANQLLQLTSVKRMLSEAELKGKKVVVASGFVFWFEDKDSVGWIVKEASYSQAEKSGNILWKEGTILSKNHGRIVVLPYVKENGELVQGHTKNAPHDGKAKPRHPKEYVELPFEVLEDDLMIGLFGDLKYE
ncbi:hypothetical protein MWT32_003020 [Vibrio parahaemolyticus]|uniref:hypothetical protein n=1 Tax=Vibrio parahaemolyticus TaxID=670 RepID=UPI0022854B34|nr:hypothetical protein [Vibrio parahaemolyticus]EJA3099215.1 hypothetical protein [Vibrio parahaemolyticus]